MPNGSSGESVDTARESLSVRVAVAAMAGLLCAYSFVPAFWSVYPAQWPHEWDTFRDIGIAQTVLDGRYPEDPIYAGEINWFNPLTGLLIAATGRLLQTPLPRAAVLIGPFVNLLTPVFFFLLAARLVGARAALAGLLLVLFGKEINQPYWISTIYCPWLMAPFYAPGLMFLTLLAFLRAVETNRADGYAAAGVLLGVTFLAHTAPALVAGSAMLLLQAIEAAGEWLRTKRARDMGNMALRFLLLLGIAFGVSLPFSGPILWEYHFRIQNPWPSLFAVDYMSLDQLPLRLRAAFNLWNLLAVVGLASLVRRCGRDRAARLVCCWTAVTLLFLAQHYLWQLLLRRGVLWPGVAPGHHAALHLSGVRALLFGAGAMAVGRWAADAAHTAWTRARGASGADGVPAWGRASAAWIALLAAALCVYVSNPRWIRSLYGEINPDLRAVYHERQAPMYQWILANTPPGAHFLCDEESVGITTVLPAGRKLLDTMIFYSNPYVNQSDRSLLRQSLLAALDTGDVDQFREALDRCKAIPGFSEKHFFLLLRDTSAHERREQIAMLFEEAFQANGFLLFRLRS